MKKKNTPFDSGVGADILDIYQRPFMVGGHCKTGRNEYEKKSFKHVTGWNYDSRTSGWLRKQQRQR
jgi:hypothetical protein